MDGDTRRTMSALRWLNISQGDVDHPADIVAVTPKGTVRRVPLTIVELGRLVQQASNLLDMAVREMVREQEENAALGLTGDTK